VKEIVADMIIHQHVNGLCVLCVANMETIVQQLLQWQHGTTTITTAQFQYHVQVTSSELSLAQTRKRNTKLLQGKKTHHHNNHPNHNIHTTGLVQPSDVLATITLTSSSSSASAAASVSKLSSSPSSPPPHHHHDVGKTRDDDHLNMDDGTGTTNITRIVIQFPCGIMGSIIELNESFLNVNQNDCSSNDPEIIKCQHNGHHPKQGSPDVFEILQSDPYLQGYMAIVLPSGPFPPTYQQVGIQTET
jgi:hypothetical protein